MKLNKKGMTLIEIIISIVLISIVLIFLFSLLIKVNEINKDSEVNSTYLITKALIVKNIESDLSKYDNNNITISKCDITDFYNSYSSQTDNEYNAYECIKITYGEDDNAYLGIYYHTTSNSYVISYVHDNVKATRELPEFEKYNVSVNDEPATIKNLLFYSNDKILDGDKKIKECNIDSLSDCKYDDSSIFHKITIPIIGSDGKDYSILISYYGTVKIE